MKTLSLVALLSLLGASASVASASTIVNLGFDTIQTPIPGTTGDTNFINPAGWNLPADNSWGFGYGPVTNDNPEANPNFPAEVFFQKGFTAAATGSATLGSDAIIAGNSYTINVLTNSLLWDNNTAYIGSHPDVRITLTVKTDDDSILGSEILVNSVSDLGWANHAYTFVAPTEASGKYLKLEFNSNSDVGAYGLITGISATTDAVVPEPASLALLASGSLLMLRRRK